MSYWPDDAKLIQVDINSDRVDLTKPVDIAIQGDEQQMVVEGILA